MNLSQRYRVNTPTITAEIFDDEIVIIHLKQGTYYSLSDNAAEIWKLLQNGADLPDITANLIAMHTNNPDDIASAVQQFVEELAHEQLLVPESTAPQPLQSRQIDIALTSSYSRHDHFILPSLNKYTDMQDLLLLDPIHDVTESGWPHVKSH